MDLTRRRQDWTTRRQGADDPFSLMSQDLQRLAGNMMSAAGHTGVDYPLNLYESDEAYVLELAVPGMSAENIDLNMEGRHVTIHARMPQEDEGGRRYFVRGISEEVRQHLHLPSNIDSENVSATVANGLRLKITFSKAQEGRARKINIQAGENEKRTVDVEASAPKKRNQKK